MKKNCIKIFGMVSAVLFLLTAIIPATISAEEIEIQVSTEEENNLSEIQESNAVGEESQDFLIPIFWAIYKINEWAVRKHKETNEPKNGEQWGVHH